MRSATAAGIDGVIVPHKGTAEIGPVAIKASAGVAFRSTILRCETTTDALSTLREHRFQLVGLDGNGMSLFDADLPERAAYVVGNESSGLSDSAAESVDLLLSIPLRNDVESLNAAVAASIVGFELARRAR